MGILGRSYWLSCLVLVVVGCKKESANQSGNPNPAANVYLAIENGNTAVYWNNGISTNLTGGAQRSYANQIVLSGADVYIAGSEQMSNGVFLATYWKNGQAVNLPNDVVTNLTNGTQNGIATGIYVSGSDVYLSGVLAYSFDTAVYWKNGVIYNVATPALANSIFVSGDSVYLGGETLNFFSPPLSEATYWLNGVATSLSNGITSSSGDQIYVAAGVVYVAGVEYNASNTWVATFWKNGVDNNLTNGADSSGGGPLYVSGTNVYVAGAQQMGGRPVATYWKNGIAVNLLNPAESSAANAIFVSGSDVYLAGYSINSQGVQVATYWKNGQPVYVSDGTRNAQVNSIYVH
jgi:hypothetical protein